MTHVLSGLGVNPQKLKELERMVEYIIFKIVFICIGFYIILRKGHSFTNYLDKIVRIFYIEMY